MDTCSNCGAAVRPGAKFCTACGTRLNDVDSSASGSSGWEASAPPVEDAAAAPQPVVGEIVSRRIVSEERSGTPPETTGDTASGESAASTVPTAWRWGSTETDNPAERIPILLGTEDEPARSSETDSGQSPASRTEPFQWSWGASSAADMDDASERDGSASGTGTDAPAADDRDTADTPFVSTVHDPVEPVESAGNDAIAEDQASKDDRAAREAELADAAPPYDWRQSVTYSYRENATPLDDDDVEAADAGVAVSPQAGFAESDGHGADVPGLTVHSGPTGASDAQTRAMELLDQLRSLIPELGAASGMAEDLGVAEPTAPAVDTQTAITEVLEELERERDGISTLDDLRSVLEAAERRPRDMDVILDLVARAGSLVELLDERDRLVATIDRTVSRLRS